MFMRLKDGCTLSRPWPKARPMGLRPEPLILFAFDFFHFFAHKSFLSILSVSDLKTTLKDVDNQRPWRGLPELHLEQALAEGALHEAAIRPQHACMVDAHAVREQVLQLPAQKLGFRV